MADYAVAYAGALLLAARRENAVLAVEEEMGYLAAEFAGSAGEFDAPVFPLREQLAVLESVLGDKFHPLTKRFVILLASMRRLGCIIRITDEYIALARKELGRIDLNVTAFEAVTPETAPGLVRSAGEKGLFDIDRLDSVCLNVECDKSLLGGFIAECCGIAWDCSLKAKLRELSKVLRKT